jgi:hypothetical protein
MTSQNTNSVALSASEHRTEINKQYQDALDNNPILSWALKLSFATTAGIYVLITISALQLYYGLAI